MCVPWDTTCLAGTVTDSIFEQIANVIISTQQWLISTTASWWVMVPSISLYPNPATTDPNAAPIDTVVRLHALILPITAAIAVGGVLWNALMMVLTRKPAPLVNVLRGLWNTTLWAAVGVFGTNLLLQGTDAFSTYVITLALDSIGEPSLAKRLSVALVPVTGSPAAMPLGLLIIVSSVGSFCAGVQAVLMLFRDGSVLILAPMTTLAAAGDFTEATRGWKPRLLSWGLGLIFYKAIASMVYATFIWLTGENKSSDPRVLLMGMALMIVALIALPATMKFFNWTVGAMQGGGGGLGMLASAGAAGMHAAASLRGATGGGGGGANEHARYLNETFDRRGGGGGGSVPTGSDTPTGPTGPGGGGGGGGTPRFQGPSGGGGGGIPLPLPAASPSGQQKEGRETGDAVTGVINTGTKAAEKLAPLTGPAAPVVAGTAAVVRTGTQMANSAANAMADGADNSTKGK